MTFWEDLGKLLGTFAPFLAVVAVVILLMGAMRWLLLRRSLALENERKLPRQLTMLALTGVGIVAIVLALPVSDSTREQLLSVFGLLVSAIIALASTTLVANAMAGIMLRTTKNFRTGDFVRVDTHFGRVTQRGLLYTEIQTEDRELTALPNLYLISNPLTVVRSSGTLVSISLSLGYDVHHIQVEPVLIEAAKKAELAEPFVRILELGNYAVTYRVSGFLADIKNLLSARSNLCKMVLEGLHGQGIEIVSPSFMNQRPLAPDGRIIPASQVKVGLEKGQSAPEEIMFDKAERAEQVEQERLRLKEEITEMEGVLENSKKEERPRLKEDLDRKRKQLVELDGAAKEPKANGSG